jgi:excinuclease UvrABC ATPase subunit
LNADCAKWLFAQLKLLATMILAPVVQNRKGSHTKMLDELSNQGFLRARVDGKVIYLDELDEFQHAQTTALNNHKFL